MTDRLGQLGDSLQAVLAVPPHVMGEPFAPANDQERDAGLLAHADAFCARYGVAHADLSEHADEAHYRRWKRQFEAEMAAHDRWWTDLQRRRALYGYGLLGRLREWWGDR